GAGVRQHPAPALLPLRTLTMTTRTYTTPPVLCPLGRTVATRGVNELAGTEVGTRQSETVHPVEDPAAVTGADLDHRSVRTPYLRQKASRAYRQRPTASSPHGQPASL